MGSFDVIVSSLYTNFLLRDFAAKIVPGSALLLTLPLYHTSLESVIAAARGASILEILVFASIAWTVSYAVQTLGERRELIHQWPTNRNDVILRYQTRVLFSRFASDRERRLVERYVVIKEAGGTVFLTLLLCGALVVAQWTMDWVMTRWPIESAPFLRNWLVPIVALIALAYYSKLSHEGHLRRQYGEIDAVITLGHHDSTPSPEASGIHKAIVAQIEARRRAENEALAPKDRRKDASMRERAGNSASLPMQRA